MGSFQGLGIDLTLSHCDELRQPSYINLALSIFILFGILLSYVAQHYRIIHRGTSEGLSGHFVILGTTSGTCSFANILVLPTSRADIACCQALSGFECTAGLLGIAQVGAQWSCFSIIFLLFLIYPPRDLTLPDNSGQEDTTWRETVTVGVVCVLHALLVVIISVYLVFCRPDDLGTWANILGITAAILAISQYFPQLKKTWDVGHVGSLSIPMMLIQTPGSFVWSASLAARVGLSGWSTWGVFLLTGCLQGCLLIMCLCFEIRDRKAKSIEGEEANARCIVGYCPTSTVNSETDDEGGANVEDRLSERTPLIKRQK